MTSTYLSGEMPATPSEQRQQWQRGHNGYALTIAVVVHLLLLAAVLSWRSQAPPPAKPRSSDISIVEVKQPPKVPEPPPPAPKLTEPPPPNIPLTPELPPIEVPRIEPVPQAVAPLVAPPVAAPPAATAPAPAPVVAAAPPPAASAVGSKKMVEDCADAPDRMMVAEVYRLSSRTTSVKEMDRRKPLRTVCLAQLNIAPRHMGLGLPGLDISEWFGLDIRFTVNVPQEGSWDFVLLTDDGSVLYVDDVQVIDNDGLHGADAVMGTVANLTKGVHNIRVRYFQGPGDGALMIGWKRSSDAKFVDIPRRLLGRPATPVAAAPAPQ